MSFLRNPAAAVDSTANGHLDYRHAASKRKFDDFAPSFNDDDEDDSLLVPIRMKKDDHHQHHHHSNHPHSAVYYGASSSSSSILGSRRYSSDAPSSSAAGCSSRIQFFIRMLSAGNTLVVYANSDDTVKSLHQMIEAMAGIRVEEQRLLYNGKQLQWEQSLAECSIENDANLQLVGRMRSTGHPQTWQVMDTMISLIRCLFRGESGPVRNELEKCIPMFFEATPKEDNDSAPGHFQVFLASSAPAFLVRLFMSSNREDKKTAASCIRQFMESCRTSLPESMCCYCSPIVLEFCKLLREVDKEDDLYVKCRSTLGWLMESTGASRGLKFGEDARGLVMMQEIFPFVDELADKLCIGLESSLESPISLSTLVSDVRDFIMFLNRLRSSIEEHVGFQLPISLQLDKKICNHPVDGEEIDFLHDLFVNMLSKMDKCLTKVEERFAAKGNLESESVYSGWSQYLVILRELHRISELYLGAEERFWEVLRARKSSLCALIIRFAMRTDDYHWLLQHKDVTDFESRRHLTMLMFPEVKEDYEELHEMLIDRSQLLAESFRYIGLAERDQLHSGLFMEFKSEEATGPGVLREWFFLVCQAIFNPENALFVPCPNDRRRFLPNPASKVNPLHLEYFNFAGRIIALALMHKVQVGIVFDRVFYLQLGGERISLEDIRDADPCLYSSCREILEMDPEFIDSDALGLTFVREVDELGCRRTVELCAGGKNMIVNSRNRKEYVHLLIQHRFVTSVSEQVFHFSQGFSIVLQREELLRFFFQSLELEELDWMLYGSESLISMEDWKAHTDYNGYGDDDPQITWFWKIVDAMTADQKKTLLFFWTSVKYLPVEGFRGLASRLYIYKSSEPHHHLPSSHTCFYRLCFPPYPSMALMQDRLHIITQEHVGCSFGTW